MATFFSSVIQVEDDSVVNPVDRNNDEEDSKVHQSFDPSDGLLHFVMEFPTPVDLHEKCRIVVCELEI